MEFTTVGLRLCTRLLDTMSKRVLHITKTQYCLTACAEFLHISLQFSLQFINHYSTGYNYN